jgi:hypothetical protein
MDVPRAPIAKVVAQLGPESALFSAFFSVPVFSSTGGHHAIGQQVQQRLRQLGIETRSGLFRVSSWSA